MPPPLHPGTKQPVSLEMMTAIFPENLVMQEMSPERWIEIPEPVRDIYALWRPTPLLRAVRLEKALKTPAHIYYKYEGGSPAGSHKPNTAVPQAYYNKLAGTKRLATETGAGQWGSSLALACQFFGLECTVYMVKVSFHQKPYRKMMMETWGANVFASPSDRTEFGRKLLAQDPDCPGSLGIAISEAIEDNRQDPEYEVLAGQCSQPCLLPPERHRPGVDPADGNGGRGAGCRDRLRGGGSNFAGISFPFIRRKLVEKKPCRIVAVEPTSCPSITRGDLRYDLADTAEMTPLMIDVHARAHLHAAQHSCRRPALPTACRRWSATR